MDAYNRYLMRASGERQHQAQSMAESAIFAALDVLKRHEKLGVILQGTEQDKSRFVDEMVAEVGRALIR